jgi:large subunit ribosomal protein L3
MKCLIAQKTEMTQRYNEHGVMFAVTILRVLPTTVTQVKTTEKDGYAALQLTAELVDDPKKKKVALIKEFRAKRSELPTFAVNDPVTADQFASGDKVKVTGTSRGRGFQGGVKRYGFKGSPKSHGHKDQLRMPGSIGSTGPQKVFKGTRMAGRMGGKQVSVTNLEVFDVQADAGLILIKGSVPGKRGSIVTLIND